MTANYVYGEVLVNVTLFEKTCCNSVEESYRVIIGVSNR